MQERTTTPTTEARQVTQAFPANADAFDVLETLRTFEKRHAERTITQRVYSFMHGGNQYAIASNGWAILALRTYLISKPALSGLRLLPDSYVETFAGYFESPPASAKKATLKMMRAWCGAPKYRQCPACEQSLNVTTHAGNLFDRAIDRNLIAMAIAFGNEDDYITVYPGWPANLSPIVFRHEHFLAVVMPMRTPTQGLPVYPEIGT